MNEIRRQGHVFANGELAGMLTQYKDANGTDSYSFEYNTEYINQGRCPIGYHFALSSTPYKHDVLHPFFTNLISEGWVRVFQANRSRLDKRDDFGLLLANGGDLIGAISVKPATKDTAQ
jgi:serine/threonine-protein kinase HipA